MTFTLSKSFKFYTYSGPFKPQSPPNAQHLYRTKNISTISPYNDNNKKTQLEHQAPSPGAGGMLSYVAVCDSFVTAQCVIQCVSVATAIPVTHSPHHNPDRCCCCHAC